MADDRLLLATNHIFNYLITELPAQGIPLPDRRYIHAGEIAQDVLGLDKCAEQFIVAWNVASQGLLGASAGGAFPEVAIRCAMPLNVNYTIALYRCVPTVRSDGRPPSVPDLIDSAERVLTDGWTLASIIVDGTLDGGLTQNHVEEVGIGNVAAVGPGGGLGGVQVSLQVSIL